MAEQQKPKWYDDDWVSAEPEDDIKCRDCMFRCEDRRDGGVTIKGHTLGVCKVFPELKPDGVLWNGESCPYYVSEKE